MSEAAVSRSLPPIRFLERFEKWNLCISAFQAGAKGKGRRAMIHRRTMMKVILNINFFDVEAFFR